MLFNMATKTTVDTDVVVLPVMVAETLPAADEIWLAFGSHIPGM